MKLRSRGKLMMALTFALGLSATSCGLLPANADGEGDESGIEGNIPLDSGEDGQVTGSFSANSDKEQFMKSDNNAIKGSQIVLPPNALSKDTEISIQEGQPIADGLAASELGLTGANALSASGPAVVIASSELLDANEPFTAQIPLNGGANLMLVDSCENVVVVFKVNKAESDGDIFLGVIPTKDLNILDNKVEFQTKYFGSFQTACAADPVEEKIEVETATPIQVKREKPRNDLIGSWVSACRIDYDDDRDESHDESDSDENSNSSEDENKDDSANLMLTDEDNKDEEYNEDSRDDDHQSYRRSALIIGDEGFVYRDLSFKDEKCEHPTHSFMVGGSYKLPGDYGKVDKAKMLDVHVTKALMTVFDEDMAEEMRRHGGECAKDIKAGEPFDMEKDCFGGDDDDRNDESSDEEDKSDDDRDDGPPQPGDDLFLFYKIDGNKVFFSEGDNHGSSEDRGDKFDEDPFLKY